MIIMQVGCSKLVVSTFDDIFHSVPSLCQGTIGLHRPALSLQARSAVEKTSVAVEEAAVAVLGSLMHPPWTRPLHPLRASCRIFS